MANPHTTDFYGIDLDKYASGIVEEIFRAKGMDHVRREIAQNIIKCRTMDLIYKLDGNIHTAQTQEIMACLPTKQ